MREFKVKNSLPPHLAFKQSAGVEHLFFSAGCSPHVMINSVKEQENLAVIAAYYSGNIWHVFNEMQKPIKAIALIRN